MALDDRYANKFAPLDSTAIYPKSGHQLLYISMTGEIKCPTNIPLPCAFHSISSNVDATYALTWSTMIWSTSYHHMIILVHWSWLHLLSLLPSSIGAKSCSSFTATRSITPKPLTCPSRLQPVHQAKSCLDLLHLDHMTQCHVSFAISSFIITCVSFATSPSHFHLHGICCSHIYLWTNHLCISHKHN